MNCEDIILSVIVVLLLMFLIVYMCKCNSHQHRRDNFTNKTESKPLPRHIWGGVPLQINSVMDHGYTGHEKNKLPITNSMTAIRRLQAEYNTYPWKPSNEDDVLGGSYVDHFMKKRKIESQKFPRKGYKKNTTEVRYMMKL